MTVCRLAQRVVLFAVQETSALTQRLCEFEAKDTRNSMSNRGFPSLPAAARPHPAADGPTALPHNVPTPPRLPFGRNHVRPYQLPC